MDQQLEQVVDAAALADGTTDAVGAAPPAEAGPLALARLIEYKPGCLVALAPHTTYALIEHPQATGIPGAVRHAYGVLTWQNMLLPFIDLGTLLHAESSQPLAMPRYALIVAYQSAPRRPLEYGAVGLDELPQTVAVADAAHCPLPQNSTQWPRLALSCFYHAGQAVPILDTARLFATTH